MRRRDSNIFGVFLKGSLNWYKAEDISCISSKSQWSHQISTPQHHAIENIIVNVVQYMFISC